ncbi:hypothetical protein MHYP_G00069920 [Metynnis hypsauchen]
MEDNIRSFTDTQAVKLFLLCSVTARRTNEQSCFGVDFTISVLGRQLRPVVRCAAGISAAALTSCFLFYRWRRVQDELQREITGQSWRQLPFIPPVSSGPLARSWHCRDLDRENKVFVYTFSRWCSDYRKLVEVKLHYKAIYRRLESEHWWVLSNDFYHVHSLELPPHYFATVSTVACIKAKFYLRSESSKSSMQDVLLQTEMSRTFSIVTMDSSGCFQVHDSSHAQVVETPAPVFSRPRGPPPGF